MEETKALVTQGSAAVVDMKQYESMAEVFIKSGYFDAALGKCAPEVAMARAKVKLAVGAEIGLPPFLSLQGIYWMDIEGQAPSLMKGAAVCAYIVGKSKKYRHTTTKEDKDGVTIEFEELRGTDWVLVYTSIYTMEMATKAGLAGKKNWLKNPIGMMWRRAMTIGSNKVAADELNGPAGEPDEGDFTETPLIPETLPESSGAAPAEQVGKQPDAEPKPRRRGLGKHSKGGAEPASGAEQAESPTPPSEQAASDENGDPDEGEFRPLDESEPLPGEAFDTTASAEADMADQPATLEERELFGAWMTLEKFPAATVISRLDLGLKRTSDLTHGQFVALKQERDKYIRAAATEFGWEFAEGDTELELNETQIAALKARHQKATRKPA